MRALITGYGGFAGGHLADELLEHTDWELWGSRRPRDAGGAGQESEASTRQRGAPEVDAATGEARAGGRVRVLAVDLRDPEATRRAVEQASPDRVFHLAGQSFVPAAQRDPWGSFETNVRMQINLLEALAGSRARILAVTSCEIYGAPPEDHPVVDETAPLAPINAYAASKAAQDLVAGQYSRSLGLDVLRARPFNHIGPGQSERVVLPAFARQVARIEAGLQPPRLSVGNLEARRDFSDVRDIVRGYRLLLEKGRGGAAYNLGSGRSRPISELVDALLTRARVDIAVETDPERLRPNEIPELRCDAALAREELGWQTEIPFETSIDAVLAEWRDRVGAAEREPAARAPHA